MFVSVCVPVCVLECVPEYVYVCVCVLGVCVCVFSVCFCVSLCVVLYVFFAVHLLLPTEL